MKKILYAVLILIALFLITIFLHKALYPRGPAGPWEAEMVMANQLMDNPFERIIVMGYRKKSQTGNTYLIQAKTFFNITWAEISATCDEADCYAEVIKRGF